MHNRSGTGAGQTLRVHRPGGSSFLRDMTSWLSSRNCHVKSKIWLLQSMRIWSKNIPAKLHTNPIWNDGALKFFEVVAPTRTTITTTVLWSPSAQIWMKVNPYYQRRKRRPMTLVSGNIRCMRIFVGVPLGGGVKWEWGCRRRQFLAIWVATSCSDFSLHFFAVFDLRFHWYI